MLNRNPFDFIERNLIARAIIELGGARALMRRHHLGVFERPASFEVGGNACCPEGMAADLDLHAEVGGAALDHAPGIHPVHRCGRECAGASYRGAEQGALRLVADAGGAQIFVEEGFEFVVGRHLVALTAFLVQAYPPALAAGVVVLDFHRNDGADAREAVNHDADQRPIAQADQG